MTFHVIDKRTGNEPIFDHNHIFKEKWFKESGLIWCDIDGWYISEDGQLVLIDDCGKCVWVDQERFEVVIDEPTVCDIEQIRAEIDDLETYYDNDYFSGNNDPMYKCDEVLQIIDHYKEREI